jgi:peptidoglycan-N-acetylglucosamine deacetylase
LVLTSPTEPYRVGTPYWKRGPKGIVELPITVTHGLSGRLPYIGTSLVLAGTGGARLLSRLVVGKPFINLELHGIDLADAQQDGLGFLLGHQPDLKRDLSAKEAALRSSIGVLRESGYRFVRLAEAAAVVE